MKNPYGADADPKAQPEPKPPEQEPEPEPKTTGAMITDAARMAIPLGTAVIVGVLIALGLEGDARSRFIRDEPNHVFIPLALVLIGVTLPAVAAAVRAQQARTAVQHRVSLSAPDRALIVFILGVAALVFGLWWADDFSWSAPVAIAFVISGLVIIVLSFAALRFAPEKTHRLLADIHIIGPEVIGSLLVLAGALSVAFWGTEAIAQREQPDIVVSAQTDSENARLVNIQVEGSGLSLRSRDKMLVRVMAVKAEIPSTIEAACRNPRKPGREVVTGAVPNAQGELETQVEGATTRTLYWGESGPTSTGSTDMAVTLQVSRDEYQWVCVYATLSSREFLAPADRVSDAPRLALTILDLNNAGPASPGKSTPSSTPSGSEPTATTG